MKLNTWQDATKLVEHTAHSGKRFSGKLLHVYQDSAILPDGSTSGREWIRHPGACAIVPVFEDGTVMLVKQFRYPVRQIFFEVPAGKIDPGEPPEETAVRETEEETGLSAHSLNYVGHFYPVIGYSDEIIHIYVAWGLQQFSSALEEDEFLINVRIPFSEAIRMIELGEITDGKTICSLMKCKMWWEQNQPFPVSFRE